MFAIIFGNVLKTLGFINSIGSEFCTTVCLIEVPSGLILSIEISVDRLVKNFGIEFGSRH